MSDSYCTQLRLLPLSCVGKQCHRCVLGSFSFESFTFKGLAPKNQLTIHASANKGKSTKQHKYPTARLISDRWSSAAPRLYRLMIVDYMTETICRLFVFVCFRSFGDYLPTAGHLVIHRNHMQTAFHLQ